MDIDMVNGYIGDMGTMVNLEYRAGALQFDAKYSWQFADSK